MRYVYSVIRFVPDPARGEFINVGAIVGSEESSEWEVRQIENPVRARTIDDRGILDAAWGFIDRVGRQIDAYEASLDSLLEADVDLSESWLNDLSSRHRNIVQLSPPTPMVATSANEALDRVFDLVIKDPARITYGFAKKHRALGAMKRAFRDRGLEKNRHVLERVTVEAGKHRERLDFAVVSGDALQLTQTWSFQVPDQDALAEQVKAWGWTMERVVENGGQVTDSLGARFDVGRDVDIEVVYVPPQSGVDAPALDEAWSVFSRVHAEAVTDDKAGVVADRALKLVG